jgi:S1-C subfamily serine protease
MKKLSLYVFLGLLWCNISYAGIIELKKCWLFDWGGEKSKWSSWEEFATGVSDGTDYVKYENNILTIDTESGLITFTRISTDAQIAVDRKYLKLLNEKRDAGEDVSLNLGLYKDLKRGQRIFQTTYLVNSFFGSIIEAKPKSGKYKMFIYLKKNQVEIEASQGIARQIYHCIGEDQSIAGDQDFPPSGTAFFISKKGHLLTNNHVVDIKECKSQKINYFNKEYETKIISTDKALDLALLKANVRPKSFISFSKDEPKKRDLIIIAGYPLGKYLSDDLKINEGKISSLKGFDNNSNEITVDVAINPGNSGGPIVDENGQLIAVAVAGMSKEVTEGISFGIKSSAVTNFLKSNKIRPDVGLASFSMNKDKVNQLLEESTVYTFCN